VYYFYVLHSLKDGRLYKGYTSNFGNRFIKHQAGGTPSTKYRRPLVLIYLERYPSKTEALARESWAKTLEGGSELLQLLVDKKILAGNRNLNITSSPG